MSYILDALRRADEERERGAVPSLHSQHYAGGSEDDERGTRKPLLLVGAVVAAVVIVALIVALAWVSRGGAGAPRLAAQEPVTGPLPAAPATAAVTPAMPVSPSSVAPAALPAAMAPQPATAAPPVARGGVRARPDAREKRELARALASMKAERRGGARSTTSTPATAAPKAAPNVGTGGRLPDELRRELPTLAFGGASYSTDPASRMVIFNGRVFHEGETIAPELVLKEIERKAAIFTYKGYRYEVDF